MVQMIHTWLQRMLPRGRRDQYGQESTAVFLVLLAEARRRGRAVALWLWVREVADMVQVAYTSRKPSGSNRPLPGVSLRSAWRVLRHQPGFAVAASLIIALGVGATGTVFAVADRVWWLPMPFPEPHRLVDLWEVRHDGMTPHGSLSSREADEWPARLTLTESLAAYRYAPMTLTGVGDQPAARLTGVETTHMFGQVLGRTPVLGRWWNADEDLHTSDVVVISESLWRSRLGANPNVLQSVVRLDGQPRRVVGVWPADAAFPASTDLWMPSRIDPAQLGPGQHLFWAIGRLAPGVTLTQARDELSRVAAGLSADFPDTNVGHLAEMDRLSDVLVAPVRPMIRALVIAAVCLLLIAASNLAGLLLSRALQRQREFAVRRALGARPLALIQQLLVEGVLLAAPGALLGILLASWSLRVLVGPFAFLLPNGANMALDIRVIVVTIVAAIVTGVGAQVVPIWRVTRAQRFSLGGRDDGAGRDPKVARRMIVGTQLAVALALVCAALLLSRSLWALSSIDRGFEPTRAATFQLQLSPQRFRAPDQQLDFVTRALEAVRGLPGVAAVGVVSDLPFSGSRSTTSFAAEGVTPEPGRQLGADYRVASPGYFSAMAIDVVEGRDFQATDTGTGIPVAVVNRSLARQLWPDQPALGKTIRIGHPGEVAIFGSGVWRTVVGVVEDIVHDDVRGARQPELYIPFAQSPLGRLSFVVRTASGDALAVMPAVRSAMAAVDPNEALYGVRTMEQRLDRMMASPRVLAVSTSSFALAAVLLAGIGIYATLTYTITQRAREFGVRLALGASPAHIVSVIGVETAWLAVGGLVFGSASGYALARLLSSELFGVTAGGVWTYTAGLGVLIVAAILAMIVPIRRALRLDPARLLQG